MTEYIFPIRIVDARNVTGQEHLLMEKPLQIGLAEAQTTAVADGGYVILDFGVELCGSVRILTYLSDDASVHIRFGESLTECCSQLGGDQNATNDHSLRDLTVQLPRYSDMTFGNTGFRFVRLDFNGNAELKSVVAVNHILKQKAIYRYEGSDPLIARIFETAKRTVDLCASSGYVWDGIKRDRLVWIGDIHPEMLALTTLYGRSPEIEQSLDFIKDQTPLPGWMNRYPMYSMWWIIILQDYFDRTGCTSFAKKQIPYLEALIDQLDGHVLPDGTLNYPRYFVDWPTRHQSDELDGARAINIIAVKKAIRLLESFRRNISAAEALLARLLKIEICPISKQVTALKYFAVGLDQADKERLVKGGAKGMSTFMSYYILKAVASFDKTAAIAMMKEYYGAMLDKGATTFWEDFNMDWAENSCRIDAFPTDAERDIHGDFGAFCYKGFRHSLCHGWSAGVISFIQEACE